MVKKKSGMIELDEILCLTDLGKIKKAEAKDAQGLALYSWVCNIEKSNWKHFCALTVSGMKLSCVNLNNSVSELGTKIKRLLCSGQHLHYLAYLKQRREEHVEDNMTTALSSQLTLTPEAKCVFVCSDT